MAGRRLGQHFLKRESVLERIAAAACPQPEPLVIEIGPGKGALTRRLLERAERVIAVELDPELARRLPPHDRLTIVHADVLETDLEQWGPAVIAGNLPYYITSPIVEKVLAARKILRRAVFLVQKEVAERLTALPGGRDYGYLTVQTRLFSVPEFLFQVPPDAFSPPPKVDSAVVRLTPSPAPVDDPAAFLRFAGQCFRQKRKTLRNNLAPFYGKDLLDTWPEASLRAEQLSVGQFLDLYRRLQPAR